MNIFSKKETFTSKNGKEIILEEPSIERLPQLLEFVNRLTEDDTYLSFTGEPKTLEEERLWIKSSMENMKHGKNYLIWAIYDNKIIGSCDIIRGGTRDFHVGTIGLMVDRDFRGEGIGKYLLEYILGKAGYMENLKIAKLDVFSDNEIARTLYQKLGFKEFAKLPNGFYRKGKFTDALGMYKELTTPDPSLERRET